MVFERISDANKVTLSVEKMSEEFFGINYFYRKSLEIRLISPKLVQIFVRRKLQFLFYCGRHCSYHTVAPRSSIRRPAAKTAPTKFILV